MADEFSLNFTVDFNPLEVVFRGWEVASLTQRVESYRMGWVRGPDRMDFFENLENLGKVSKKVG